MPGFCCFQTDNLPFLWSGVALFLSFECSLPVFLASVKIFRLTVLWEGVLTLPWGGQAVQPGVTAVLSHSWVWLTLNGQQAS